MIRLPRARKAQAIFLGLFAVGIGLVAWRVKHNISVSSLESGLEPSTVVSHSITRQQSQYSGTETAGFDSNIPNTESVGASQEPKDPSGQVGATPSPRVNLHDGQAWAPDDVARFLSAETSRLGQKLYEFFTIKRKQVRSAEETERLKALASDTQQITAVADFLSSHERVAYSANDEALRMTGVSFLGEALRYQKSSSSQVVNQAVRNVILADNLPASLPENLRLSIAGDKVELAMQMMVYVPSSRGQLLAQAQGINREIVQRAADYVGQ